MLKIDLTERNFPEIFRIFISGSSSSGKTHFARNLLAQNFFRCDRIYYFHPDINESFPINWQDHLSIPIITQANLPTLSDIVSYPKYSCLVLDDLYTEASASKDIDYLFRVLSSKKKLHVIIMTQRYFAERGNALNIRNSSNFHVLMTNSDARINGRVGHTMLLKQQIDLAEKANSHKLYPYIFIDRTNQARVSGLQVYTEIFGRYHTVVHNLMLCVVISKQEFESQFEIIDNNTAVKHGGDKKEKVPTKACDSGETERGVDETNKSVEGTDSEPERTEESFTKNFFRSKIRQRKNLDRKINQALRRYQQRSLL